MDSIAIILLAGCAVAVYGEHLRTYNYNTPPPPVSAPPPFIGRFVQSSFSRSGSSGSGGFVTSSNANGGLVSTVDTRGGTQQLPKVHEIHTSSGRQHIRIEEYRQPAQVIRVHEAPQAPPQVLRVQAPPPAPTMVRVIQHSPGRARVERVVFQPSAPQFVDVQRPPPAPARVVQIERGPATDPRIIFHREQSGGEDLLSGHASPAGGPNLQQSTLLNQADASDPYQVVGRSIISMTTAPLVVPAAPVTPINSQRIQVISNGIIPIVNSVSSIPPSAILEDAEYIRSQRTIANVGGSHPNVNAISAERPAPHIKIVI